MALHRNYTSGKSADGDPVKKLSVAELIQRLQAMPQHLPVVFDPSGYEYCLEIGGIEELAGRGSRRWIQEGIPSCPEGCVVIRAYDRDRP